MALTLAPELLAAQTAQSRKPIIELTAGRLQADYPFLGTPIANPDSQDQGLSLSLFLADGRLAVLYAGYSADYGDKKELRYIVTDTAVSEFSDFVVVDEDVSRAIIYLDGVVMDDGNIAVVAQLSTDVLALYRISPAGVKLSETQLTGLSTLTGASVCQTATGYALVYTRAESGTYTIYLRTSTDFVTWGGASTISISGLDSSHQIKDPRIYRLADGSYILIFAYATLSTDTAVIYNLQYSTSTDLATWAASVAITSTSDVTKDYVAPDIVQKSDGSLWIAVQESSTYLELNTSSTGWDTTDDIGAANMWVDEAAGKLYLTSVYSGVGTKKFHGTCRVDIATWAIEKFYGLSTTPPVPAVFGGEHCFETDLNSIRDGYATIHASESNVGAVAVIDYNADTISAYYFADISATYGAGAEQNVTHALHDYWDFPTPTVGSLFASEVIDGKLWLAWHNGHLGEENRCIIGYIDLAQLTPPFDFHIVNTTAGAAVRVAQTTYPRTFFYPADGIALIASEHLTDYDAPLHVVSTVEDATVKCYRYADYNDFPLSGVTNACLIGGATIYAVPFYDASHAADASKWGLMEIDLNTDTITYYQPPWITTPGNYLGHITVSGNELIFRTTDGVAVFNYVAKTWQQLENTVIEGLPPTNTGLYTWAGGIAYDSTRQCFFYGSMGHVYLVPRDGEITSIKYITESGGVFANPATLVTGYNNIVPSIALNSDDEVYATWTSTDLETVCWDKAAARIDLGAYLTDETSLEWAMDAPARLKFTVSHGHLFDPHNANSLLKSYLTKGKGVSVRMGDTVSGVDYWTLQGTYVVRSMSLRYQRDDYPLAEIVCEDVRSSWAEHQVIVADVDMQTPEAALVNLVTDHSNTLEANISVPSMPLSFAFDAQWIDSYLSDIVDDVAHRFQHFVYVRPDGNIDFRPISITASPVNTYSTNQIIEYTPDDSYSDLTNRITVTGQSLHDFQITYAEERLGGVNGTLGWWGCKKDYLVPYSEDESKRAKNPRLKVIETSTGILFKLAGKVTERISEEHIDHRGCVVEVKAPSLIPLLISAIAIYAAGNKVGDSVMLTGMTTPIGRRMEGVGLMLAMMVLGSVANFQFEVWGNPIGYLKRSYQASADDEDLQQELGMVTESKMEGFLCHTPAHCQAVADFEMMVAMAQRSRVAIKKITHLQDEIGDTVTLSHPYTGQSQNVFVTNLTRRYKPALGDRDGYVIDEIEGWAI